MKKETIQQAHEFFARRDRLAFAPVFMVFGSESLLKAKVVSVIRKKFLTEGAEDFDTALFYGDETKAESVLEQLESLPFLSERRVIVLKDADSMRSEEAKKLVPYIESPSNSSVFIVVAEKPDKRLMFFKRLSESAVQIECKPPRNPEDIRRWLITEMKRRNLYMDQEAMDIFCMNVPMDYAGAFNELEKIILLSGEAKQLTKQTIIDSLTKLSRFSEYDLVDAVGAKNKQAAMTILKELLDNDASMIYIVSLLSNLFVTLWKIRSLRNSGISEVEISNKHIPEVFYWLRKNYIKFASNYSVQAIREIFHLLYQFDCDLKSLETALVPVLASTTIYKICSAK